MSDSRPIQTPELPAESLGGGSLQRMIRRKELRRGGMSFREQDERMARLQHHLEEAHGSIVLARMESLLLREPCSEKLNDAIDCVEYSIEQTLPAPSKGYPLKQALADAKAAVAKWPAWAQPNDPAERAPEEKL